MRRLGALGALALMFGLAGAAQVWANHIAPPTTVTLPGGAGRLTVSVESRKGPGAAGVDCQAPAASANGTECYDDWRDSKAGSGGNAQYPFARDIVGTNPVNGGTCVPAPASCTVTWGGVYANTPAGPAANGRAWTGVSIVGVGSLSLSAGGGAADASGHPNGCVTAYAQDGTSGHTFAGALYAAKVSDDASDYETDVQLCGVIGG